MLGTVLALEESPFTQLVLRKGAEDGEVSRVRFNSEHPCRHGEPCTGIEEAQSFGGVDLSSLFSVVSPERLERSTHALKGRCSTN